MITFDKLRDRNRARQQEAGVPVDTWTPGEWLLALIGEAGEACNIAKKLNRLGGKNRFSGDETRDELLWNLAKEIGDIVIYADLLCERLGLDLGEVVSAKFDETSRKRGLQTMFDQGSGGAAS